MTLARRLLDTRKARGLTMKQAADELGCHENSYRLWELGAQTPRPNLLKRIREWLDIDADTLLRELASEELTGAYLAHAS